MNREIKIILVKFMIITISVIVYTLIMFFIVAPAIVQTALGQNWWDFINESSPFVYGQSAFDNNAGQYQGQQQYGDPNYQQFQNQFGSNPYQNQYGNQYGQYGTPQYGQPYGQPYQNNMQFGIQEIIYTIISGGSVAYGRYNQVKVNKTKDELESTRETMKEMMNTQLQDMRNQKDLSRIVYSGQGTTVTDAPNIQLANQDANIQKFQEKVAKT